MARRRRSTPHPTKRRASAGAKKKTAARRPARKPAARRKAGKRAAAKSRTKGRSRIDTLRTPPSSLDLARGASAARSGRRAIDENRKRHPKMAALTGGDVDADMESAYFSGDETPGGDNPTPDQNDVDEIGHAMGVEYQDNEELKSTDKVDERDRHRWDNE